jgi:antitoxin CptB
VADNNARAETPPTKPDREQRLGRITFRAWRRGFREADLVLGPFIAREGTDLSDDELDLFEDLLSEDDHEIYAWIIESAPTPERHATALMDRLRVFMRAHVAAVVADGAG